MSTAGDDETPFDALREDVDLPLTRLFREYAPGQLGFFAAGMVANFVAQMASLVPPLILGAAIDAIFLDASPFELPLVPNAWLPGGEMAQFQFSVAAIATAFLLVAVSPGSTASLQISSLTT